MLKAKLIVSAWFFCLLGPASLVWNAPGVLAQETAGIKLPAPDMSGGQPVMAVMKKRRTDRTFAERELTPQQISDLLWAGGGLSRPEEGKYTVPVMKAETDLIIHLITPEGVYLYDPAANELGLLAAGDHRAAAAGPQAFAAKAPVNVVLSSGQKNETAAGIIVGHSSQNIYLYCASAGLNAVTRMTMDRKAMGDLLKLPEGQRPLLVLTIGPRP